MFLLKVQDLTGGYAPHQPVIFDIDFTVKPGEMVGLIGLNGAGKSTTIKHILGYLRPHSGAITFQGKSMAENPMGFRREIAYIAETPYLYPELTLEEHLELTAMAYHLDSEWRQRMEALLEEFQMAKRRQWYPSTFSKGMRQKVMILCALLVRPSLLIVDEPFVGLDPLAIHSLLEQLTTLKREGTAILLSTHVLATAEKHAQRFVLLKEGRIALNGTLEAMRTQAGLPHASLDELFVHTVKGERA
ncbi:ABC transporter ATP-binding protein [Desmospora activa]|uniref:ABC-2 type transport system ATP-binding protein n=1 Tax=Desmospora activa DSM 45169 TaxID=1121389 RepID=A0A2T4Z8R6_9BACL|nr:ABC transporter ATP-binding protein [Desmospora activa]PTM58255.1 ABC-2 type transport system ATP-binding protein [Desmospora activa DSM 45169]